MSRCLDVAFTDEAEAEAYVDARDFHCVHTLEVQGELGDTAYVVVRQYEELDLPTDSLNRTELDPIAAFVRRNRAESFASANSEYSVCEVLVQGSSEMSS